MKKGFLVVLVWFFSFFSLPLHAGTVSPPPVTAKAWLLMDVVSHQVLASRHAEEKIGAEAASKLMTAYLVFGAIRDGKLELEQTVTISDAIGRLNTNGPRMFLQPGEAVSVRQLLQALVVTGGDDAALALGIAAYGNETTFVELMNQEASRLGMTSTVFTRPGGDLNKKSSTTTSDLAMLATSLIRNFPEEYSFFSERESSYKNIRHRNLNRLLWLDPAVDGILVVKGAGQPNTMIASAQRDSAVGKRRMLSIVTGTVSDQVRSEESLKLLNWGFQKFDTVKLFEKNQVVATPKVWKGSLGKVEVGFNNDTYVAIPKGTASRLSSVLVRNDPLFAPMNEGAPIGVLKIAVDDQVIAELPVVALEPIRVASLIGRIWDSVCLWFT